jgi:hypothetical protein
MKSPDEAEPEFLIGARAILKRPLQRVLPGTRQRPQPFDLVEDDLRLAKEAAGANRELSPFVFPAQRTASKGAGHLVEIKGPWAAICKAAQLSGVRVHDLRH